MYSSEIEAQYRYEEKTEIHNWLIGVVLAITSSIFIGSSFVIKKISLQRLSKSNSLRAGAGGFGYLRDYVWWAGFLCMGFGEIFNLVAYGFAPASLVTPLGALSVLISAVLSAKYLQEHLTTSGKVGCALCIVGSIIIIMNAPKSMTGEYSISMENLQSSPVIIYSLFVIFFSCFLMFYLGPKYGNRCILIYVILCSQVGSFTVMASKVFVLSIRDEIGGTHIGFQVFLISFIIVVVCVCIQMTYLNKALDIYGTTLVTPMYYVFFTTLVLLFSAILFDEWRNMTVLNIFGTLIGLLIAFIAMFLLHTKKDNKGNEGILKNNDRSWYS